MIAAVALIRHESRAEHSRRRCHLVVISLTQADTTADAPATCAGVTVPLCARADESLGAHSNFGTINQAGWPVGQSVGRQKTKQSPRPAPNVDGHGHGRSPQTL
jgi:hypothetical protein